MKRFAAIAALLVLMVALGCESIEYRPTTPTGEKPLLHIYRNGADVPPADRWNSAP